MDLSELKDISQQSYDINLQKTNALRKAQSDTVLIYQNHIFKADAETICLAKTLSESHKTFVILDTNSNPVEITDPGDFLTALITRQQSALNTYHQLYQKIKARGK